MNAVVLKAALAIWCPNNWGAEPEIFAVKFKALKFRRKLCWESPKMEKITAAFGEKNAGQSMDAAIKYMLSACFGQSLSKSGSGGVHLCYGSDHLWVSSHFSTDFRASSSIYRLRETFFLWEIFCEDLVSLKFEEKKYWKYWKLGFLWLLICHNVQHKTKEAF